MAIWKGAHANSFSSGRSGHKPEAIVIHIMDGTLIGTDSWFNDPISQVAAHYGIGRKGEVHQYVRETDTAYHAGTVDRPSWTRIKRREQGNGFINPNFYTIGIEHEGKGLDAAAWPAAMRQASLVLVADIARRWSIPIDADHIIPHHAIRAGKPDCPGRGLDFAAYLRDLAGVAIAPPPPRAERPFAVTARIARTAFIRANPHTQGIPLRKAFAGDKFQSVAAVTGEDFDGNENWLRNPADEFVWAGNTDQPYPR